jgi:hypothetical protein
MVNIINDNNMYYNLIDGGDNQMTISFSTNKEELDKYENER